MCSICGGSTCTTIGTMAAPIAGLGIGMLIAKIKNLIKKFRIK